MGVLYTPNERLRRARLKRFLTLDEAAELVQVDRVTFHRWERGKQRPHLHSLKLLCQAFEMSPEELGFDDLLP